MYRDLPEQKVYLYVFSKSVMCADSLKVSHFYANNFSAERYEDIIQCRAWRGGRPEQRRATPGSGTE